MLFLFFSLIHVCQTLPSRGWCFTGTGGSCCVQRGSIYGAALVTWQVDKLQQFFHVEKWDSSFHKTRQCGAEISWICPFSIVLKAMPQIARSCGWPGTLSAAAAQVYSFFAVRSLKISNQNPWHCVLCPAVLLKMSCPQMVVNTWFFACLNFMMQARQCLHICLLEKTICFDEIWMSSRRICWISKHLRWHGTCMLGTINPNDKWLDEMSSPPLQIQFGMCFFGSFFVGSRGLYSVDDWWRI